MRNRLQNASRVGESRIEGAFWTTQMKCQQNLANFDSKGTVILGSTPRHIQAIIVAMLLATSQV